MYRIALKGIHIKIHPPTGKYYIDLTKPRSAGGAAKARGVKRPVWISKERAFELQSLAKKNSKLTKGKKVSIVHFDAHTDCYEKLDHFLGAKKSAAHWASYLVKQGNVDPSTSTQIGIRGNPRTLDWLQASYDIGYQVITMDEYKELGHEKCSKMILDRLGDNPIYVTFDLDCLDATVAPGVANIESAFRGFNMDEARKLIQSLKGKNIIGGDVACLMPTKDNPNQITSMVASAVMFEIICLISHNLNK